MNIGQKENKSDMQHYEVCSQEGEMGGTPLEEVRRLYYKSAKKE